mgnify:FL=1
MDDKPRYSRVTDIIELIILMQSKVAGVSLNDIQEEFDVSRRTAERMRDSVLNLLPQVGEIPTDSRVKRWGFINYSMNELVSFSKDEIATLEKIKQNCDKISKKDLSTITNKIKTLNQKKLNSLEQEIEFILNCEGYAVKQSPNYKIDLDSISTIREAIRGSFKLSGKYNDKEKILSPLGLLFGEKIYLVAIEDNKGGEPFTYLLHRFQNLKLTNKKFDSKGFDLREFAKKSFGVFQGEIYNVKLNFDATAAEDASNYNFHPTQKGKWEKDGSYTVTFKASGDKHIIWNLFKWGDTVKIIAPKELKKKYKEYLQKVLTNL